VKITIEVIAMAFLDFIKNRQQQQAEQAAPAKQETARDYHVRQDAQDKAALRPMDGLPEQPKAELNEVKARMEKATQQLNQEAAVSAPAPQDGASSPEPLRQNMASQGKPTPDLTPTSMQAGSTLLEKDAPAITSEPKVKESPSPTPTPDPTPTPGPRGRGGWER
jgi:hypothetical protein